MEETSANVVLPDMAESGTNDTDNNNEISDRGNSQVRKNDVVRVTAVEVPVTSISVGSLINVGTGETFNLITSDQIQQFTENGEFLCVDNNCSRPDIKENNTWHTLVQTETGNLNTTHVVIQNPNEVITASPPSHNENERVTYTYEDAVNMPVLHVRCKRTNAELHKNRFGSGGRGRCIKLNDEWFTPNEFEAFCGRGSSKDWKRSIRFAGRSLLALVNDGVLVPHATSCTCSTCVDDVAAAGPVRLYTPYKRRKLKRKKISSKSIVGSNDEESCDSFSGRTDWPATTVTTVNDTEELGTASSTKSMLLNTEDYSPSIGNIDNIIIVPSNDSEVKAMFEKLNELSSKMLKMADTLRTTIKALEVRWEMERQENQSSDKDGNRGVKRAKCSSGGVNPGLQPRTDDGEDVKKCANCNREAYAECSSCRNTPYCSTFCQRKDWAVHQIHCRSKNDKPNDAK